LVFWFFEGLFVLFFSGVFGVTCFLFCFVWVWFFVWVFFLWFFFKGCFCIFPERQFLINIWIFVVTDISFPGPLLDERKHGPPLSMRQNFELPLTGTLSFPLLPSHCFSENAIQFAILFPSLVIVPFSYRMLRMAFFVSFLNDDSTKVLFYDS